MNILITGGAGFIGSHLAKYLLAQGHEVHIVDNLSTGSIDLIPGKARFHHCDIRNTKEMQDIFTTCKIGRVFHLAALARIQRSWDSPEETYDVNVNGTFSVLTAAKNAGIRDVFITSSSSVFAGISMIEKPYPVKATDPVLPLNPYAYHKHLNEQQARLFRECFGMNVKVGRPFNVFGENQLPSSDYATVIVAFAQQKHKGEALTVYGDGQQTRDFTYVGDVVRMMVSVFNQSGFEREDTVFNFCSESPVSIEEVAKAFNAEYVFLENPRSGEAEWTYGQNNTGIKPSISIINWLKEVYE